MLLKPLTGQGKNQTNTLSGGVLKPLTGPGAVQMPQAYQKPAVTPTPQVQPQQKTSIFKKTVDLFKNIVDKISPKKFATQKLDNGFTIDLVEPKKELKLEKIKFEEPKVAGESAKMSEFAKQRYTSEGQEKIRQKNLEEIQGKIRPIKEGYKEPKTFGQAVEAIKQGSFGLVASLGASSEMIGQMTGHILLTEIGQKLNTEAQKVIASNPEWTPPENQPWGTEKVARLVAGAVPSLLATIGAGIVGRIGSFTVGFGAEAGSTYQEAKDAGVPEGKAQIYGTTVGIVNGVLETIFPTELLTPAVKKAKKQVAKKLTLRIIDKAFDFGLKFAKSGLLEGSTEALQELVSNTVATQYDENRKLWDGMLESFVGGFGSGGLAGQFQGKTFIEPGEYTPQEVRDKVINSPIEETKEGKEIIKATFVAEEQGQNIKITSPDQVQDLNRKLSEKNTAQVKEDTLAGKREDKRIDNDKTLKQFQLYNQEYNKPGVTIETKVYIFRAGAKEIQIGDHVTVSKARASSFIDQRVGAKLFEKQVQIKDLVFSEGLKSEQIYAPKTSLSVEETKKYKNAKEFVNSKFNQGGRIKLKEIDSVFNSLPDGTTDLKGFVYKKGNKLYPTKKLTSEILKNSNIDLASDGSIKEGIMYSKALFMDDLDMKSKLTDIYNKTKKPVKKQPKVPKKKIVTSPEAVKQTKKKRVVSIAPKDVSKTKSMAETTNNLVDLDQIDNIKKVKSELGNLVNDFSNLSEQATLIARIASEQREGLNTTNINKLKRIYIRTKAFQAGDIETIRSSKWGSLLNRVIENVQEKNPNMSEQEAFDYAMEIPTRAETFIKKSPEMKVLAEKKALLDKYLNLLLARQRSLTFGDETVSVEQMTREEVNYNEWQSVLKAQKKASKVLLTREVLETAYKAPIESTGKRKMSKAYSRVFESLSVVARTDPAYATMNIAEQIALAEKFIDDNPDMAMKIAMGLENPPPDITDASISIMMAEKARTDKNFQRQADLILSRSLRQTRRGQEIVMEKTVNSYSPEHFMQKLIQARLEIASQKRGWIYMLKKKGKSAIQNIRAEMKTEVETLKAKIDQKVLSKLQSAQKLIDSITCK